MGLTPTKWKARQMKKFFKKNDKDGLLAWYNGEQGAFSSRIEKGKLLPFKNPTKSELEEHNAFAKKWNEERSALDTALDKPNTATAKLFEKDKKAHFNRKVGEEIKAFNKDKVKALEHANKFVDEQNSKSWANTKSTATAVGGAGILSTLFSFCSGQSGGDEEPQETQPDPAEL